MKRGMILFSMVAMLAVSARCQTAMIALDDIPGTTLVCVTNYGPQVVSLTARVTGIEGSSNDWSKTVSNLAALSNNVSALSSRVTATNALFSAWFAGLQSRTSYWDAAYSWGDWSVAVGANTAAIAVLQTNTVTRAGTNGFVTASITNGLASTSYVAAHTNRTDNPHGVTAPQIGALTNELDLAALRTFHYGSPDIVESPAEWFVSDGAGTITAFNWEAGRTNVVIPWAIGGVPVTAIGENAFQNLVTYQGHPVVSVIAPQTVTAIGHFAFSDCYSLTSVNIPQATSIGNSAFSSCNALTSVDFPQATSIGAYAFIYCHSLTSVDLPQVTSIGDNAFYGCTSLASVYFNGNAPTIGADIFAGITPNQVKIYVTNPQATGWGATLGGMPVVRLPLYADAIYQAGELVATFSQIAASNALPYTAWTGTVTPADGTATVSIAHGNMPVLVTDAPCVLTLDSTGYGTAGVSRVSLSYYPGTHSFTFATNIIKYAETPTVDTNGWNTLLIRRVSDGAWKGVGL